MTDYARFRAGTFVHQTNAPNVIDSSWYVDKVTADNPDLVGTNDEAEWLLGCVREGGGITWEPGSESIYPYMGSYAAVGLARAARVTSNPAYLAAAVGWCNWYAAHMDPETGYVDDWVSPDGTPPTDSGNKDSTDAYAGMFLMAVWRTYAASGDVAWVTGLADALQLAYTAITSTVQDNGLTYALPTYDVWYLEDNLETLAGLRALQVLADIAGNATLVTDATATATRMSYAIGEMWNGVTGTFDYAIHSSHFRARNDWEDSNSQRQQIWALGWGTRVDAPAQAMYASYSEHLDWSSATYEVMGLWALRRLSGFGADYTDEIATRLAAVTAVRDEHERGYPWTCAISGQYIVGELGIDWDGLFIFFPGEGTNLLPNRNLVDSNADGLADSVTSAYGSPTLAVTTIGSGPRHYQEMTSTDFGTLVWDPVSVTPGYYYTFSVTKKLLSLTGSTHFTLKWEATDAGGTNLGPYGYAFFDDINSSPEVVWITVYVPSDSSIPKLKCTVDLEGGAGHVQFAQPTLERSGNPTALPGGPATW